jgi:hypothetical protein
VRRRRTGAVLSVAMVIVFGSLLASAMFHGLLVSGQSNLDRLDSQIQEERTALAQEKLDLADLQSPARIAAEAERRGMVPADQQHWVTPGSDDAPIVTGTATADPDGTADGSSTDTSSTDSSDSSDGSGASGTADELATGHGGGTAQ